MSPSQQPSQYSFTFIVSHSSLLVLAAHRLFPLYILAAIAIALFFSQPHYGPAAMFARDTTLGTVGRMLLPVFCITIITFAAVHLFCPDKALFVFVVLFLCLSPFVVWGTTAILERIQIQKSHAYADVQGLNNQLNAQVQELLSSHEQIKEALHVRAEFLAKVSHELRTPLGGIISTTELLLSTKLSPEQNDLATINLGSGQHLLKLIDDILDFSKIDQTKLELENIDVDVSATITSAVEAVRAQADQKRLELLTGIQADVPGVIKGDPGRIKQVLINLLDNAIKFTSHGQVILEVFLKGGTTERPELLFIVKDSGIGIPAQLTDHLFQPFVQADGSMTRRYGGSGLGLAISKSLVELMGGKIGIRSALGEGCEFWFTLPLERPVPPEVAVEIQSIQSIPATVSPKYVLVVEDNPVNAKLAILQLNKLGYMTDLASNGREALCATDHREYSAILMDIQMPVMDGLEATRRIRLREVLTKKHVPIIALTAHGSATDRQECMVVGMEDCLTKPPTLPTLAATLKRWIPATYGASFDPS